MRRVLRGSGFCLIAALSIACNDRSALERQAQTASSQRLIGMWYVRFHLDRAVVLSLGSESTPPDVSGQLAFLANRWVRHLYPMMDSPSDYGSFDVDFTPFGFDARSNDETPTAGARWLRDDSLEILLGDPNNDVTVRMVGRISGDTITGGWRVLVARTGGGGGRFVMVRHK